jgi:hypothetical protein
MSRFPAPSVAITGQITTGARLGEKTLEKEASPIVTRENLIKLGPGTEGHGRVVAGPYHARRINREKLPPTGTSRTYV